MVEGASENARAFARDRLPGGPIHIAPMVDIVHEFGLHGRVEQSGEVRIGRPIRYLRSAGPRPLEAATAPEDVSAALPDSVDAVSARLSLIGYFGPFGIDAFTWKDVDGTVHLRAVSEVNARYTLGFGLGAPELIGLDHAD